MSTNGSPIIHPAALLGLAHVLQSGWPKMTSRQAVENAGKIIDALHVMGLEVAPVAAFGAHAAAAPFDALDLVADMVEKEMGRKPWLP